MCGAKLTDVNATNYAHYILSVNSLYYKRISFDTSTNLSWLGLVGDKLMFHSLKLPLGKNKNFIKENLWRCICEWLEFAGMLFLNVSCGQANNILKAIMQQILSKMHQQLRSLAMPTSYAAIYSWCVVGVFDDLTRSSWPSIKVNQGNLVSRVSDCWLVGSWKVQSSTILKPNRLKPPQPPDN